MRGYFITGLILIIFAAMAAAEAPEIQWTKVYGGGNSDWAYWVEETDDSGFILAGYAYDKDDQDSDFDMYIVRTDRYGDLGWEMTYGGEKSDLGVQVMPTADGGFMVAGFSCSYAAGYDDIRLAMFDSLRGIIWEKSYGLDYTKDITCGFCRLLDGNYLVAGNTADGIYIFKINPAGDILSETTIDDISQEVKEITATSDGGAIVVTWGSPMALIKLNSTGGKVWSMPYASASRGNSVIQTSDGGYAALGWRDYSLLDDEFYLVRVDSAGAIIWEKHYGNQYRDRGYRVRETADGGLIMVGTMFPPSGTEWEQVWVVRTDADGDTLWTKAIGGDGTEIGRCIQPTSDYGYIIAGKTNSYLDNSDNMYIVKLGPDPVLVTDVADNDRETLPALNLGQNYPNPFNPMTTIDFNLPRRSNVAISVYNMLGQEVAELTNREYPAGQHQIIWDGCLSDGQPATTGIYFYRLQAGDFVETKKMLLLK